MSTLPVALCILKSSVSEELVGLQKDNKFLKGNEYLVLVFPGL